MSVPGAGGSGGEDISTAAEPWAKLSAHAVLWALKCVVLDRMSIARVAANLGAAWHTVNTAALPAGRDLLIVDPGRFASVAVIGVDEHAWSHVPGPDRYVTDGLPRIIDLTPVRDGTGPSRLLDMVPGRFAAVFTSWLATQSAVFRDGIQVVAMDGFTGFKTATTEQLPAYGT